MFQIKICGLTQVEDARQAIRAGADAIGLNFWPGSPRYVSRQVACDIVNAVQGQITIVGVFVDAPPEEVNACVAEVGLDAVQLHGSEPPSSIPQIAVPVMKAWRLGAQSAESIRTFLGEAAPAAILLDAWVPGVPGGTGVPIELTAAAALRRDLRDYPVILAGGLNPENVARAIEQVRPWGVDCASGVEATGGRKSAELMERFIQRARKGLTQIPGR